MGAVPVQEWSVGHYASLGVPVGASARSIERAFLHWRERRAAGAVADDDFLRAESAYIVLTNPALRARHDTQLGLRLHPAWALERASTARRISRFALQHLARGRPREARVLLARAVALAPDLPLARSYLGLAMAHTGGSLHEAARHGEYAVDRHPEEPAFLFNLAEVYAAAGLRGRSLRVRLRAWVAVGIRLLPGSCGRRPQSGRREWLARSKPG